MYEWEDEECVWEYEVLTAGEKPMLWVHHRWRRFGQARPSEIAHKDADRFEGRCSAFETYLTAKYGEFEPPLDV